MIERFENSYGFISSTLGTSKSHTGSGLICHIMTVPICREDITGYGYEGIENVLNLTGDWIFHFQLRIAHDVKPVMDYY